MTTPILATKLYVPQPRPNVVVRPRLIERLNEGLRHKLTLISAPAGFGKTTLISEWLACGEQPVAWLSLDEGDNDPARFLTYLVAALQTIAASVGEGMLGALQSPQPPPTETILTALLNDLVNIAEHFILVIDDYHVLDAKPVDHALTFLLEHLPPQMHLVIATREDPQLPLARLRAGGQLTELRVVDLRFTPAEAAQFLNQVMGLALSAENIAALETRTEGWVAGLQLAAISLQGHPNPTRFITEFTGSHHFVMDYLVEEVLHRQPPHIQTFLLRTSILDRLCGPLCDAVVRDLAAPGQATLEYLDRANLFVVPLDHERRWYRYHHLFAELLRQRLQQRIASSTGDAESQVNELHIRASIWYEAQGLDLEAFQHAAAAHDVERAARMMDRERTHPVDLAAHLHSRLSMMDGERIPMHLRGAMTAILDWLASLPKTFLDARPTLLVRYASGLLIIGQTTGVEEKLRVAEAALQRAEPDDTTRDLIGQIAAARAVLASNQLKIEPMQAQSRRALEYLHPKNLLFRTIAYCILGSAYLLQGDRAAARQAYTEAIALSEASGNIFFTLTATTGLGTVLEAESQLHRAAATYQRVLQLAGDMPQPMIYEAHLGLAHILYEWNDLEAAEQHGHLSIQLARQLEITDRFVSGEVFLARLKLAQGDAAGAAAILADAGQSVRQQNFVARIPEVAAAQVLTLLHQGNLAAAAQLAQAHELPISQARVYLAQGDASAALAVLEPWLRQVEAKEWADERLRAMVLQALALQAHGDKDKAMQVLCEALVLAQPGGFIRTFVDEGPAMAQLLSAAAAREQMPDYIGKLLSAINTEKQKREVMPNRLPASPDQSLIEPLSRRELEVLHLIAQGLSNQEISERLFLALDTV
ncbi:MAG TPA: LuxR C-terminal-related transcriptional regulator, partial [Ktedonobacterales bacterium]